MREEGKGLPGEPGKEEEGEDNGLRGKPEAGEEAGGVGEETGERGTGEGADGVTEDIAKIGIAARDAELKGFEDEGEDGEAGDDVKEGAALGFGGGEGPLAD